MKLYHHRIYYPRWDHGSVMGNSWRSYNFDIHFFVSASENMQVTNTVSNNAHVTYIYIYAVWWSKIFINIIFRPFLVNELEPQYLLHDRSKVYEVLYNKFWQFIHFRHLYFNVYFPLGPGSYVLHGNFEAGLSLLFVIWTTV